MIERQIAGYVTSFHHQRVVIRCRKFQYAPVSHRLASPAYSSGFIYLLRLATGAHADGNACTLTLPCDGGDHQAKSTTYTIGTFIHTSEHSQTRSLTQTSIHRCVYTHEHSPIRSHTLKLPLVDIGGHR